MNFFTKTPTKSTRKSKKIPGEKSSTSRSSSQAKEGPSKVKVQKKSKSDSQKSHSGRPGRTSSPRHHSSPDSHPLNLPPDSLRKFSLRSSMTDTDAKPNDHSTNYTRQSNDPIVIDEDGPVPPPHRSNPASPTGTRDSEEAALNFKSIGNQLFKAKEYKKAIEEYTKAIEVVPSSATILNNRAAAYIHLGQYKHALEDCVNADILEPNNPKILFRLARIYTSLGRPQDALDTYARIQPPASSTDIAPVKSMLQYIKSAEEALQNGMTGSMALHALDQAEKLLGHKSNKPRSWKLMRGEALMKMGNANSLGDAQNIAMSLLRRNNADPEALLLRGRVLYFQGDNEKAIQHIRQALNCDPDYKEAVKYLRMIQKLERTKIEGNIEYKAARYEAAKEKYSDALLIDPLNKGTNSKLLQNRALCHIRQKNFDEAVADSERALALDPTYIKAKKTKATAIGMSGNWEAAAREWRELYELDPRDPIISKELRTAELELKKSKRKDYYKILGLEKDADAGQIKKAYRKAAIVHHPDKNPDDESAAERFKDIGEAYETLSDPEKRARYDNGEDLMDPTQGFGGMRNGGMHGGIDPEILMQMFGAQMNGGRAAPGGFSFSGGMPGGARSGYPF